MDMIIICVWVIKRLCFYFFGLFMIWLVVRLVVVVDWDSLEVIDLEDVGEEMFVCFDYRLLWFYCGLCYFGDRGGFE